MTKKVTVLLPDEEFVRFDAFCEERGFKKSTLIAKLVRELLNDTQGAQHRIGPTQSSPSARPQGTAREGARHA